MRAGVFTPLLSSLPLADVLKKLARLDIRTVELGTGNYPGDPHCKLSMLTNGRELAEFEDTLAGEGFSISALSCHGNPLHPDAERARHDRETSRRTILLAEKLGVPGHTVRIRLILTNPNGLAYEMGLADPYVRGAGGAGASG